MNVMYICLCEVKGMGKTATSISLESIQKQSSPPSISVAILSRIVLQREVVTLRLSLYFCGI